MRIPSLITALVLIGFALACGGVTEEAPEAVHVEEPGEPEHPDEPAFPTGGSGDPFSLYVSSSFDYCDAKVLSALWGEDTYEAKHSIGRMIGEGHRALLGEKLEGCRERALADLDNRSLRCHFNDIGVSYEDAVLLAAYWGVDTWEAKMRTEEKYLRDGHDDQYVRAAIRDAIAAAGPGH